jgi:hypothetical protein
MPKTEKPCQHASPVQQVGRAGDVFESIASLYGFPDPPMSFSDQFKEQKQLLSQDIQDILHQCGETLADFLSDTRSNRRVLVEARERISVVAIDRLSFWMSHSEIAEHIGLARTTMIAASNRFRQKNHGEVVRLNWRPNSRRHHFRDCFREPKTKGKGQAR